MATVWKAEDPLLGRTVALKVLDEHLAVSPKSRRRFLHEAQAASALDHPGIIAVHDFGQSDGHTFMALAYVDGETVSELAASRLLAFDEAVRIIAAAADGIGHAHERQVIHRDVTGRNIMVARDGRVIVLDFGLALAAWESRVTTTEVATGTVPYMAPEVIQGRSADARSDIYGLGVVLYEAVTGAFPFPGEHGQAVMYAATKLDPVPPSDRRPELPPALEAIIRKAIARDAAARFQSAGEFAAALRAADLGAPPVGDASGGPRVRTTQESEAPTASDAPPRAAAAIYLAVVPFTVSESNPEPAGTVALLAARIEERVRFALAGAPGLRVVEPLGAIPTDEPREVARSQGANLLLRGGVNQAGSRLRVSYELFDPWRDAVTGRDTLDGSALQVFDLEDEVVKSVSRALGVAAAAAVTRAVRPHDPAAEDRYRQALAYLKRYDNEASMDGAVALFERLIASEGDVARYHAGLARACLHKQELTAERVWENRAATACDRAQRLDPEDPDVWLALGQLALHTGRHAAALEQFDRVLASAPGSFDALLGSARAHHDAARYAEAEPACARVIAVEPLDWRGYSLLGSILCRAGRYRDAIEPYTRMLELTPDNPRGHRNLGNAYYGLSLWPEAVRAYERSIEIQPNREAYTNLGTTFYYLGREDESLAAFRRAAELTPTDPLGWGNLGNACHWIPGHEAEAGLALDRAIALMREHLERNPAIANHWARMAGWLANRGRFEESRSAVETALRLAPADVSCQVQAGHVHLQLGDRAECLRLLVSARRAGYSALELRRSREFVPLHGDPGFERLLEDRPPAAPARDGAGGKGSS